MMIKNYDKDMMKQMLDMTKEEIEEISSNRSGMRSDNLNTQ